MKSINIDIVLVATIVLYLILAIILEYSKTNLGEIPYARSSKLYIIIGFLGLVS